MKLVLFFNILYIVLTAINSSGAIYYVSTNGNNTNIGSLQEPWKTVQYAVTKANTGDTVLVNAGKYDEYVQTSKPGITVDGQNVSSIKRWYFYGHSNCVLQNITVIGETNRFSKLMYFEHGSHNCVVSNVDVNLNGSQKVTGVYWRPPRNPPWSTGEVASNCLFISNRVRNSSGYILMSIQGDNNIIKGNVLSDSPQGDFFNIWGRSNKISGNICSNLPFAEGLGNHPDFIQTFGNNGVGSMYHVIEQNYVYGIEGGQLTQLEGALMPEIGEWMFRNNIFHKVALQASCTIPGIKYFNNLFVNCNFTGHALTFGYRSYDVGGTPSGLGGTNFSHNSQVKNNIFLDCGNFQYDRGWYAFTGTTSQSLTNVSADHNYVAKSLYQPVKVDSLKRQIGDVGGWSTFAWYEVNGINGNGTPLFRNYQTGDFTLTKNSPVIGKGLNMSDLFGDDFYGNPRPKSGNWNIGPFQPKSSDENIILFKVTNFKINEN